MRNDLARKIFRQRLALRTRLGPCSSRALLANFRGRFRRLQFFQLQLKLIDLGRQLLTLAAKEHLPVLLDDQLQMFDLLSVGLLLFQQLCVLRRHQCFQGFHIERIEVGQS
jgi:hypothetical protein